MLITTTGQQLGASADVNHRIGGRCRLHGSNNIGWCRLGASADVNSAGVGYRAAATSATAASAGVG